MARTLTPAQKALQHEYSALREKAEARRKRLEAAGFTGYQAPKVKDIEPKNLKRELGKLRRAMDKPSATVKGARAQAARQRPERRPPTSQEVRVKPPRSEKEELRRQKHNEANKRYREREKARKQAVKEWIQATKERDKRIGQALQNLQSGLKKYGIKIKSPEELAAWGQYIKERKQDSAQQFYEFDQWLDELANAVGKNPNRIRASDVMNMLIDFNQWKGEQEALQAEFNRSHSVNEYSGSELGSLWGSYFNNR